MLLFYSLSLDIFLQQTKMMYQMDKKCDGILGMRIISVWQTDSSFLGSHINGVMYFGSKTVKLDEGSENFSSTMVILQSQMVFSLRLSYSIN